MKAVRVHRRSASDMYYINDHTFFILARDSDG